ncbi:MAG TPA: hypothetical protein VLB80_05160 [Candidatus Babeliales bacterium]|nr:hypothetical protein [Candidatus Babeliales bacterium]
MYKRLFLIVLFIFSHYINASQAKDNIIKFASNVDSMDKAIEASMNRKIYNKVLSNVAIPSLIIRNHGSQEYRVDIGYSFSFEKLTRVHTDCSDLFVAEHIKKEGDKLSIIMMRDSRKKQTTHELYFAIRIEKLEIDSIKNLDDEKICLTLSDRLTVYNCELNKRELLRIINGGWSTTSLIGIGSGVFGVIVLLAYFKFWLK